MGFNERAISAYGEFHIGMHPDAPCDALDDSSRDIMLYLDFEVVRKWVTPIISRNATVLDIGAGKGRMSRKLAEYFDMCAAIEPFKPFYDHLEYYSRNTGLNTYNCSLKQFTSISERKFDLCYASGVTPYMNDSELPEFFACIKKLLKANGLLLLRNLDNERESIVSEEMMYRNPKEFIAAANESGFELLKMRRAYPPLPTKRIYERFPCSTTRYIWKLSVCRAFWPMWLQIAELNIPRMNGMTYYAYLFGTR